MVDIADQIKELEIFKDISTESINRIVKELSLIHICSFRNKAFS